MSDKINHHNNKIIKIIMELSIIIPCLNEEETIEICINKSFEIINK